MSLQPVPLLPFDFLTSRPVEVEVSSAPLTSDAGLIPIRQFDEQIRLTEQVAAALHDPRDPALTQQSVLSMVRQRVYGILADSEDQKTTTPCGPTPPSSSSPTASPTGPTSPASPPSRGSRTPSPSPTCGGSATSWSTSSSSPSRSRHTTSRSTSTPPTTPRTASSN